MHVHILGICGTFMGSLALLARDLGHTVTGSDANVYPPMSTQLENAGVTIQEGYSAEHLKPAPDLVIVGNAMKRGIEAVEYMLDAGIPYTSGPQFLSEHVLQHRHVLAVAGTHGKTTTTTMLAWILHYAGMDAGFLIGGVPIVKPELATDNPRLAEAFAHSSHLGVDSNEGERGYFVIEADEYDSAFFDKRSKFVHYRPRTAILNNLEFDHADIFADLDAIQTQFHHMIRMIPSSGQIIMPADTPSLEATIDKGCWTPIVRIGFAENEANASDKTTFEAVLEQSDGSKFSITQHGNSVGKVAWDMTGEHNVMNGLSAIVASHHVGVPIQTACEALSNFAGIKRRMELIGEFDINGKTVHIYDDFAHHPTAITTTLDGAKKKFTSQTSEDNLASKPFKLWAIIEPRSNTMKLGIHKDNLASSANIADTVIWYEPKGLEWGLSTVIDGAVSGQQVTNLQTVVDDTQTIIEQIVSSIHADTDTTHHAVVIMSNGGFEGIHKRLCNAMYQLSQT